MLTASLGYEILPQPPYSPDLTPSDFFLFARLKSLMHGRRFMDDDKVIFKVEQFLNSQTGDFYNTGFCQVIHCWEKYVALDGRYVEKN